MMGQVFWRRKGCLLPPRSLHSPLVLEDKAVAGCLWCVTPAPVLMGQGSVLFSWAPAMPMTLEGRVQLFCSPFSAQATQRRERATALRYSTGREGRREDRERLGNDTDTSGTTRARSFTVTGASDTEHVISRLYVFRGQSRAGSEGSRLAVGATQARCPQWCEQKGGVEVVLVGPTGVSEMRAGFGLPSQGPESDRDDGEDEHLS